MPKRQLIKRHLNYLSYEFGQEEFSPAAMQMKLETSLEHRMWATRMAKHVMEMNTHLQTRLLDLMQSGLLRSTSTEIDSPPTKKRETRMFDESPPFQGEEQP